MNSLFNVMTHITVLSSGDAEALALAESCTASHSHVSRLGRSAGESASVCAFSDTARIAPSRGERGLSGDKARDGLCACSGRRSDTSSTDGIATRKRVELLAINANNLVDDGGSELQLASASLVRVDVGSKEWAQTSVTVHIRASINSLLQLGYIPSVHKVGVPRVANRITCAGDVRSFTPVGVVGNIDERLEEDADEVDWELRRTDAVVEATDRV